MKHYIFITVFLIVSYLAFAQMPWQEVTAANVTLRYRVTMDGQYLENQISAATTGWVSVGYRPVNTMQGANIIIGYVASQNVNLRDDWGTSRTSHTADTALGGVSNLSNVSGSELAGITSISFRIPLNSGDQYDRILTTGTSYQIILARGSNVSDNFTSIHSAAAYANILINPPALETPVVQVISAGNQASLVWNTVAGANSYKVYKSNIPDGLSQLINTTSSTSYLIPPNETKGFYQVKAVYQ